MLPGPLIGPPTRIGWPTPLASDNPLREIYVTPQRPGQNKVPYWQYDWRLYKFTPDRGGGGVQLYFYERERSASGFAVSSIRSQYERLTDEFHYLPRTTIPFILYASYPEFLATNVFTVDEGTLGATDPRDLRMSLPFFGNVREFSRVSTHEMVHQITLQKIRDVAAAAHAEAPLNALPLWFIEGLAEWGVFEGMDPEGDYILRDLVANPDALTGYVTPPFFNASAGGYIGVYKLGQARISFISEQYGKDKVIELLERSSMLATTEEARANQTGGTTTRPPDAEAPGDGSGGPDDGEQGLPPDAHKGDPPPHPPHNFQEYVVRVVGEPANKIEERYHEWLKSRYYEDWLHARQKVSDFVRYQAIEGEPDSVAIDDTGHLIVYRTVERETGLSALYLQDVRDPHSRVLVARDQRPGLESLHPVDRLVASVRGGTLLFAGRHGQDDALFTCSVESKEETVLGKVRVTLRLGSLKEISLGEVLEAYDPALSPDGKRVAFAGIDPAGFRDLYVVALETGKQRRLTNDVWSEADLAWDGERLLYVSDQTESHEYNVYAIDLESGERKRLTHHDQEDRHPVPALEGVVFRSMQGGKPDLWLLQEGKEYRLTDLPSAPLQALPTTDGALMALLFHSGQHRLFRLPKEALLREPKEEKSIGGSGLSSAGIGLLYPRDLLPLETDPYQPGQLKNLRVDAAAGGLVGPVSAGSAALQVTDLLRDHSLLVNLAVYGSLRLTDALLFYLDQTKRPAMGLGLFHTFEPQRDKTFPNVLNFYIQREFGVAGMLSYPLDRFRRIEGSLELRGVERFNFTDYTGDLAVPWAVLNAGIEPEVVASTTFGWDTMRLHAYAGAIEGSSLLAQLSFGYLPVRQFPYFRAVLDAQHRFRLFGRTNILARVAGGATSQGRFAPQFYLYSIGNLEGYRFGDVRLLGNYYGVANLRLNVPLDQMINIPIFTGLYGIGGFDFGSVFDQPGLGWQQRSLAAVIGADAALGALVLQLHFGRLLDIGTINGPEPWVFQLNFRYLYL